ncbi:MAG: hypothetical protein WC683_02845 [bacterium]
MRNGTGCIHDPPTVRGSHSKEQVFGTALLNEPPDILDLTLLIDSIRQQNRQPTCVGFGTGQAIQVVAKQNGCPHIAVPSARHLFAQACGIAHDPGLDGTTIGACIEGAQLGGIIDENLLPYDPAKVYDEIDLDVLQMGLVRIGLKAHRLIEFGEDVDRAVKLAVASGKGVVGGIDVDDLFLEWPAGEVYPGITGEYAGGHAMNLLDFPLGLPRWVGSYGANWAEGGLITTAWDVVRKARSLWIIDYVP